MMDQSLKKLITFRREFGDAASKPVVEEVPFNPGTVFIEVHVPANARALRGQSPSSFLRNRRN
jgi:hypothetical protein